MPLVPKGLLVPCWYRFTRPPLSVSPPELVTSIRSLLPVVSWKVKMLLGLKVSAGAVSVPMSAAVPGAICPPPWTVTAPVVPMPARAPPLLIVTGPARLAEARVSVP